MKNYQVVEEVEEGVVGDDAGWSFCINPEDI